MQFFSKFFLNQGAEEGSDIALFSFSYNFCFTLPKVGFLFSTTSLLQATENKQEPKFPKDGLQACQAEVIDTVFGVNAQQALVPTPGIHCKQELGKMFLQ